MTLAGRLPTTRWSLVIQAGDRLTDPVARQSLEELCQMYWPALYGYLRRRGRSRQDAEDLIQGFFTDLLERDSIAEADSSRGRFRAFLYASLDRFVANAHRHDHAIKRGGGTLTFSIDQNRIDQTDSRYGVDQIAADDEDPTVTFDRQWAQCLIDQTLQELRQEYAGQGKADWLETLMPTLISNDSDPKSREQMAKRLGLSATALKVAIHRLRACYRTRLLNAVAQTVDDPGDCGSERQWLFEAMGKKTRKSL
ncbi:RNA polymerase sigma factor [Stieleria varia]|uniref:Sigma-70 region 2 n=1 Tax=Stieleria varia TaxID=2528005 RepID=A0A5C5ZXZ6_9BACT|nr:sigma-70 family RNA polymerase sigma factor [Stieleria varia]TWT91163.1 Sigma-70 region 2 [Stieleria varia]